MKVDSLGAPGRRAMGFTLVEMLVVVIIILLLSAILLKSVAHFGEEARRKRCVADMEALKNALNEYYTAYGTYPPVNSMAYEYESRTNQPPSFRMWLDAHTNVWDPENFFADAKRDRDTGYAASKLGDLGYQYGLVSFLWKREMGDQHHFYDADTDRDKQVKERMAAFLKNVGLSGGLTEHASPPASGLTIKYSNQVSTVADPWGNDYRYRCAPPYRSYRLWSAGPDGADKTRDDVALGTDDGQWNE